MQMNDPDPSDVAALRSLMDAFIHERLTAKLDKLKDDEQDKRAELQTSHQRKKWLADAARRVAWLQMATHTLKPLHPDAKGTEIYLAEPICQDANLVGTHILGSQRTADVVGNAAALDVFKFLKLEHAGQSLLNRALGGDTALFAAFDDNPEQAQSLMHAFAGIVQAKGSPASHTLAKQLYFPLGEHGQGSYHLLAPLYPTALVHQWHLTLQEHRFGDAAKAARLARREQRDYPHGYHDYRGLVMQNFGGTKPQNISQLNSERGGQTALLPSHPPDWQQQGLRAPLHQRSVFSTRGSFIKQDGVRDMVKSLRSYLAVRRKQTSTTDIRDETARRVDEIVAMLLTYQDLLQQMEPGWSLDQNCTLDAVERRWLDPLADDASEDDAADIQEWTSDPVLLAFLAQESDDALPTDARNDVTHWQRAIALRFADWLNAAISTARNSMADDEHHEWAKLIHRAQQRWIREAQQ